MTIRFSPHEKLFADKLNLALDEKASRLETLNIIQQEMPDVVTASLPNIVAAQLAGIVSGALPREVVSLGLDEQSRLILIYKNGERQTTSIAFPATPVVPTGISMDVSRHLLITFSDGTTQQSSVVLPTQVVVPPAPIVPVDFSADVNGLVSMLMSDGTTRPTSLVIPVGVVTPPAPTIPAQVTGLVVMGQHETSIDLAWAAAANATSYRVERRTDGIWALVAPNNPAVTFTDTGLVANTFYAYRVSAMGTGGTGPVSLAVLTSTLAGPPVVVPPGTTPADSLLVDANGYLVDGDGVILLFPIGGGDVLVPLTGADALLVDATTFLVDGDGAALLFPI